MAASRGVSDLYGACERVRFTRELFRGPCLGGHAMCELFERMSVIVDAKMGCAYWQ